MSNYISFIGKVVPMAWGDSTYTVLPLPDEVMQELGKQGAKRVEGEINDHPINLALTKAPVIDQTFLYAGKTLLKECDITPGEDVEVRLRKADPNDVETPADVAQALRAAGKTDLWNALTPGRQRGLLHQIQAAKRAETRKKRIAALIKELGP
ncbi:protein of unknown function [Cognatiyoonia koreensis]|uniref:Bacteriocin-protection, YdeI or OmpD-Associated n=1 Tax=Cognatiyoonia koreensis TaxID=364200 RepID=A0A1I0RXJ6_9RHOB|nr:YdeI/OmpD-associated family protein [Cognatiyoonia koreensis]SEW46294.1 protein of unknown function [Cognatiyoonia koreensis]